jgi:site-specific DNA-methyltransferase (adenine-specific)/modification methylase
MTEYRLILGDCRDALGAFASRGAAIITDPPYGIGIDTARKKNRRGRLCEIKNDYPPIIGDDAPFDPSHLLRFETVVLFGANHYADKLPPSSGWIVWDKLAGLTPNDQSDCELAWTNRRRAARLFSHRWYGMIKDSERAERRAHPTQKPVALFKWIIAQMKLPADTLIIDPYLGAGACGVAAGELGYNFVGMEIDAHYFAIAERRIARAYSQARMFAPDALAQDALPLSR